jgi:hypothetical protein
VIVFYCVDPVSEVFFLILSIFILQKDAENWSLFWVEILKDLLWDTQNKDVLNATEISINLNLNWISFILGKQKSERNVEIISRTW